jgi:alkylation response protein AidB-like acyl-CoA dehydrogenase
MTPPAFSPSPLTLLAEEERALQDLVADFARNEIAPLARAMDEAQHMRPDLVERLFALGLMGISVPEELGGAGSNFFSAILAVEELSRVDPSVGVLVDVQNTLVEACVGTWGSEAQKAAWLPRLCRDMVGAYALSEAGSGSDAFALATRAVPDGIGWRLSGSKIFITNAQEAGLFVVFATVDPAAGHKGITAFLVEAGAPGFAVARKEDKLGIRASSTCELVLSDVAVGPDRVLGDVGLGYRVAIQTLNEGRIGIAAQMLGLAEGALGHALAYARERRQFGRPIFDFQAVQMRLAECATRVETARLVTYNAARLKDAGQPFVREAAMAKHVASQVAEQVASECLELFGGYGFTKDFPAEKYFRDSKIGKIYEGTTFMQLQTIAKLL